MRNYEEAAVHDKRPVHREAGAAEVFVDEGALVMEALLEGWLGRSTSGQHGCRCYTQRQKRAEPKLA
jgi:hypothetical protein